MLRTISLAASLLLWGLGEIRPLIPAFDGKGLLMASWTPSAAANAPTLVLAHGRVGPHHQ